MVFKKGEEERGCVFRVKKTTIYVYLQLQSNTSSEHQNVDLSNKCMTKDYLRDFAMVVVYGGQEDRTFNMQLQRNT
jgi:hypothetical protein